jgi:peptide/nickel transport system substrate-binding protein
LGTEFSSSATGDATTVKLRRGVTFHNGKPLHAEDVVYTFTALLDPKKGSALYGNLASVIERADVVDSGTVRFSFKFPFFDFMDFVALIPAGIVPVGYDPERPIGTGPFKFESFTPGQQSVFTRNNNYWGIDQRGTELPYVDRLVIIDMADDTARVNALLSGVVDAIDTVPYALIPSVKARGNLRILDSKTGSWYPITMRIDTPPFRDVGVRQAFRLIVDRPQVVSDGYGGYARLGNDLFAIQDPLYDHSIPQRVQDIERAKSLLRQAGYEGLTVNLVTAPIAAGVVESCVLFAQQAKAAGVNVLLKKLDSTSFYNNQYLNRVFSVDWWSTLSFITAVASSCGPNAPYNDTHWDSATFNKLYYQLVGSNDPALKRELASEMQRQLWDEGGEIIPGHLDTIDGYSARVAGFVPDESGYNLSLWGFKNVWFV